MKSPWGRREMAATCGEPVAVHRAAYEDRQVHLRSDLVPDSSDDAQVIAADVLYPIRRQTVVHELADVVAGNTTGRQSDDDITLFESQGLAIEDVAAAKYVYEAGREQGRGRTLDM